MNSIYHTELLAPSTVPFPACGEYPTDVHNVDVTIEYSRTKNDLKYRKLSEGEESLRVRIMASIYSSLLKLMGSSISCDGSRKAS